MTNKIKIRVNPNGSFANWQITSRDTNTVVSAGNRAGEVVNIEIDEALNAGYFFQVNGHTAYSLDHKAKTGFDYRTPTYVDADSPEWIKPQGLLFRQEGDVSIIEFNTTTVVLKIPRKAHTSGRPGFPEEDIFHGIERDDLVRYLHKKKPEFNIYRLKVVKGGRFFLTSAMTLSNQKILLGGGHFKFLPDGNLRRYTLVRASSISGKAKEVEILDTYYVKRTDPNNERSKPRIVANPGYWVDDLGDEDI